MKVNVEREVAELRDLASLGDIALVHSANGDSLYDEWQVWEVRRGGYQNKEQVLKWHIAEGATPKEALKNALRRVRGDALRSADG